ncbi:MAG TPA: flagellar hook-associated protein 3 [Phycisphaerales bacterium]|nr:flagellar hook-associated protein 3 [Phycisphaerales bacterium]
MSYSLDAIYKMSSWAIAKNSTALASLQQRAATGLNMLRVSEDPAVANGVLALQGDSRTKTQYLKTLDEVIGVLDLSSSVIQSITNEIARARASLTATLSGTTSQQLRSTLAADLNNALEQLVALCNTDRLNQYLFGGAGSGVPPYAVVRDGDGNIVRVTYQGSSEEQKVEVVKGLEMSALLVGSDLFGADSRKGLQFFGDTGAAPGSGASNTRGDVFLNIREAGSSYELSLDGEHWAAVTDENKTNVAVINPTTDEVLYVDASNITSEGKEPVRADGTFDMFNILISARDLLNNAEGLSESQITEMIAGTVTLMQNVEEKVVRAFPIVGGRVQTLTSLRDSIDEMKLNTDEEISRLYDADVTQVAIDLARYSVLYEMSLNVASKMFRMSLLDFLR